MKYLMLLFAFVLFTFVACESAPKESAAEEPTTAPYEEEVQEATAPPLATSLAKAIEAHGGSRYDQAYYSFVFRDRLYTFKNDNRQFIYTRQQEKDGQLILDSLTNKGVVRYVNGEKQILTDKQIASYSEGVNSVIYFATLPHKLQDPAVNAAGIGTIEVKGESYAVLQVSFEEEGGGTDFEDNYRYWINTKTNRIDYLAYDYQVNGGGVRFRSAYNPRIVDGILFQDYVNYKAPIGTSLDDLPAMFAAGELEELSRIETEEVKRLGTK